LLPFGDPGWGLEVQNESESAVLIAVDDDDRPRVVIYAPAGASGYAYETLGVANRGLQVLETDCTIRTSIETADQGWFTLTIDVMGRASVSMNRQSGTTGQLRRLSGICGGDLGCDGAATPWPTGVPSAPPMEWCFEQ
jgi:hypothetical protein